MKEFSEYTKEKNYNVEIREGRLKRCFSIMRKLSPGLLLDIGCSDGEWARFWIDKGWQTYGLDLNSECVEIAKKRGVHGVAVDLNKECLPYDNDFFDLIFAGEIIEHLIDTDGFLKELHRCLKPKGHLLLTTPNLASFENRARILFGRYPVWVDYGLHGSGHLRAYTPRVLKDQLKQNNFTILKHTGNWIPLIPQMFVDDLKFPLLSLTGKIFPSLAMDIIIFARKNSNSN